MRSDLVVISWWSNCLGLRCTHNLARHTLHRTIHVVQVGKSAEQRKRFRRLLPTSVRELAYPEGRPAEHGRVIETVVQELLPHQEGLWFFDHDFIALEPLEPWLAGMDQELALGGCALCHAWPDGGGAITSPAFWLSPQRLPESVPSFLPIPFRTTKTAQRPDLFRASADLVIPQKDTLVLAQEYLAERDLACVYSLPSLPHYQHLGGLYLFASGMPPPSFRDWVVSRVEQFTAFFASCPAAWVDAEDPVLLGRLEDLRRKVL